VRETYHELYDNIMEAFKRGEKHKDAAHSYAIVTNARYGDTVYQNTLGKKAQIERWFKPTAIRS
jgi:hypothetical protein